MKTEDIEKVYRAVTQSVLAVPGVASIPKNKQINIVKNNANWVIDININCFSYVNIWSVIRQVQVQARYVAEKISKHQDNVKINVNVYDLILEDIN